MPWLCCLITHDLPGISRNKSFRAGDPLAFRVWLILSKQRGGVAPNMLTMHCSGKTAVWQPGGRFGDYAGVDQKVDKH